MGPEVDAERSHAGGHSLDVLLHPTGVKEQGGGRKVNQLHRFSPSITIGVRRFHKSHY